MEQHHPDNGDATQQIEGGIAHTGEASPVSLIVPYAIDAATPRVADCNAPLLTSWRPAIPKSPASAGPLPGDQASAAAAVMPARPPPNDQSCASVVVMTTMTSSGAMPGAFANRATRSA
ncbi:hypothetical protein PD5205_03792 [Xanthomonas fragariae]|uniref:Uncharacterized protein n=1 Tax=Xanthomonas fragariae TaxID=48664 RepID=A0A1Y6HNH2_9XANT|nr:hypothetical protein PD5205_03792 [Xanthomonas fragariae]